MLGLNGPEIKKKSSRWTRRTINIDIGGKGGDRRTKKTVVKFVAELAEHNRERQKAPENAGQRAPENTIERRRAPENAKERRRAPENARPHRIAPESVSSVRMRGTAPESALRWLKTIRDNLETTSRQSRDNLETIQQGTQKPRNGLNIRKAPVFLSFMGT